MRKLTLAWAALFSLCLAGHACTAPAQRGGETVPSSDAGAGETGKTLIVYYSFTNNSHTIALELQAQTGADILRVEPADEDVDYNDYSIGLPMMNLIKNHPDDPASYPAVKTTIDNLADYGVILIAAPLWWNSMAAPLQSFLYKYGGEMAGKRIGLIVSSGESSIEGVEADARRLIPDGLHLSPSLWILRSQTGRCKELISQWLRDIRYADITSASALSVADGKMHLRGQAGSLCAEGPCSSISLYDLRGCRLRRTTSSTLSTDALPSGIYLVSVAGDGGTYSRTVRLPLGGGSVRLF